MKFAYVLNKPGNKLGGKEQFAFEMLNNDEYIYSFNADNTDALVKPIDRLTESDSDIIVFHDIIDIDSNLLKSLKDRGRKLVFIIHDYYPVCERFTLINNNGTLCGGPYHNNCVYCYIDKFPLLANVGRHTQDLIIKIMRPFNKTLKYYTGRKERMNALMEYFDLIVFPTEKSRKIIMRFFNISSRVKVIKHFQKSINCNPGHTDKPLFAFIGHDGHHKGLAQLYEAMGILTNSNIRVHIYGNVGERNKDKRIVYKGSFEQSERDRIFSSFNVLIFPSVWPETWGRVMAEAAACGKYILVPNIVPHEEVLDDYKGKCLFTHNSAKSLAKAISQTMKKWDSIDYPFDAASFMTVNEYKKQIIHCLEDR